MIALSIGKREALVLTNFIDEHEHVYLETHFFIIDDCGGFSVNMKSNLVISFFLNRRSYWALMARDATKEQSEITVCR